MAGKGFDFEPAEESGGASSSAGQPGCKLAESTQKVLIVKAERFGTRSDVRPSRLTVCFVVPVSPYQEDLRIPLDCLMEQINTRTGSGAG